MAYRVLRRLRPLVQAAALLLFLMLLLATRRETYALPVPADAFFRLNPLTALASMLAGRAWLGTLALSMFTLGVTLVLGRVWCGWLCPLGTVLDLFPPRKRGRPDAPGVSMTRWRQVKYFLLLVLLIGALFGTMALVPLDPITLLARTLATGVVPALNLGLSALENWLYGFPALQAPVGWFEVHVRAPGLGPANPFYLPNLVLLAALIGLITLNRVAERFWCRFLCPLGGLLGLVSRLALVRRTVGTACTGCRRCARRCPTGTIDPNRQFASDPAECTVCLDCAVDCPQGDVRFAPALGPAARQPYDPSRRMALASLATAAGGAALFRLVPQDWQVTQPLIRPPGAQRDEFWARCIRCGACMKICPTGGLQPALWQAGVEGWSTPVLVPRTGYCDYSCHSCGQACPTGAIPSLALEEKRQVVIGAAEVDRTRCLPWAEATPCIVCEEMCPVPEKAIELEEAQALDAGGQTVIVQRPRVIRERCIGCGICEFKCPLEGAAAIRVTAAVSGF